MTQKIKYANMKTAILKVAAVMVMSVVMACSLAACKGSESKVFTVMLVDSADNSVIGTVQAHKNDFGFVRMGTYLKGLANIDDPKKDGWFFDGWYLDPECTEKVVEDTGDVYKNAGDVTFYAGWTNYIDIPFNTGGHEYETKVFHELFDIDIRFEWVGNSPTNTGRLYGSITPRADFTGELSSEEIELQIDYCWFDGESFMGELVNPNAIVECISHRGIILKKSEGFAIPDFSAIVNTDNYGGFYDTSSDLINTTNGLDPHITVFAQGYDENDNAIFSRLQYKR